MSFLPTLSLILATAGALEPSAIDTLDKSGVIAAPAGVQRPTLEATPTDTPTTRRVAVDVGDWYGRRLLIHRVTAIAVPALFAYQYYLGDRLYDGREDGDTRDTHRMMRTAIIGAFGVNAVTGGWNLWESRATPEGRTSRILHTVSMVGALGGFTYAGIKLANDMKEPGVDILAVRRQHRAVALTSMGVTLVSGAAMWLVNR